MGHFCRAPSGRQPPALTLGPAGAARARSPGLTVSRGGHAVSTHPSSTSWGHAGPVGTEGRTLQPRAGRHCPGPPSPPGTRLIWAVRFLFRFSVPFLFRLMSSFPFWPRRNRCPMIAVSAEQVPVSRSARNTRLVVKTESEQPRGVRPGLLGPWALPPGSQSSASAPKSRRPRAGAEATPWLQASLNKRGRVRAGLAAGPRPAWP